MTSPPTVQAGLAVLATITLLLAGPAAAHHVGTWTPRDNDISTNFKQLKFALQDRKLDVAVRLYETGMLRKELRARAALLPKGLDEGILTALKAGDGREAERGLMVFFAALIRDLALEADRRLAEPSAPVETRLASARKFLEAIWRYYNLVDFAVTQRDARAATGVRLAFDEAETYAKPERAQPERLRESLKRIARILTGVIETSTSARRES